MKGRDVLFSHKNDEWQTPQWLFDKLNDEFHFDCDAAANDQNHLCPSFHSVEFPKGWFLPCGDKVVSCLGDALNEDWYKATYFLNPPYSQIAAFMKKAFEASAAGATVVCLIPVRSDTRYWHDYVMMAAEIRFIKGRVKFTNPLVQETTSATFPSCVVIFDCSRNSDVPIIGETITCPTKS